MGIFLKTSISTSCKNLLILYIQIRAGAFFVSSKSVKTNICSLHHRGWYWTRYSTLQEGDYHKNAANNINDEGPILKEKGKEKKLQQYTWPLGDAVTHKTWLNHWNFEDPDVEKKWNYRERKVLCVQKVYLRCGETKLGTPVYLVEKMRCLWS